MTRMFHVHCSWSHVYCAWSATQGYQTGCEIIDQDNGQSVENINFILDIGNGKVEELISYNQLLEHLENVQDHDIGMDEEHYRFRAIIGHQGPLLS